jgi:hypothetical protein
MQCSTRQRTEQKQYCTRKGKSSHGCALHNTTQHKAVPHHTVRCVAPECCTVLYTTVQEVDPQVEAPLPTIQCTDGRAVGRTRRQDQGCVHNIAPYTPVGRMVVSTVRPSAGYCTLLYCTVLYCTVLYCTVLYCTVLYCTVLYCTVLYRAGLHIVTPC